METIKREGFMAFLLQNRQIIRFFILESYIGQHFYFLHVRDRNTGFAKAGNV